MKHRTHPQPLGKPGAGLVGRMSLPFRHRSAIPFQPADRIGFCHGQRGQHDPHRLPVAGSSAGPRIEAATVVFRTSPGFSSPRLSRSLWAPPATAVSTTSLTLAPCPWATALAVEIRSARTRRRRPHRPVERGARGEPVAKDLPALANGHPRRRPIRLGWRRSDTASATARLSANSSRVLGMGLGVQGEVTGAWASGDASSSAPMGPGLRCRRQPRDAAEPATRRCRLPARSTARPPKAGGIGRAAARSAPSTP